MLCTISQLAAWQHVQSDRKEVIYSSLQVWSAFNGAKQKQKNKFT